MRKEARHIPRNTNKDSLVGELKHFLFDFFQSKQLLSHFWDRFRERSVALILLQILFHILIHLKTNFTHIHFKLNII